jgi:hypothetical protein
MSEAAERKRVILCADDFGLSEAASASIVVLAGLRAISTASCVVDDASSVWCACELSELSRLSIGLHLNLTESPARLASPLSRSGLKAKAIAALGGRRLRELVTQCRLSTNSDFAGVYDFSSVRPFAMRMRTWLKSKSDGGLIMYYPELSGAAQSTRCLEHLFLASEEWRTLRSEFNVRLVPFSA